MGLDWNPMARPKKGHELEFERLVIQDLDAMDESELARHISRFGEISEAPYETLGAPRVGHDSAANEWLHDRLREQGRENEYEKATLEMAGYYVLDLVPESPGLPVYSSGGYEGVDRYTFRGAFLDVVQDQIGRELHERAWQKMSAAELLEYGNALMEAAHSYADQHGLADLEERRLPPEPFDPQTAPTRVHILFSAAKWCLWWGRHGHGLEPYF